MDKRRNCSSGAISPLFHKFQHIFLTKGVKLHVHFFVKFGSSIGILLNSANLICRSTDISRCFSGSLRLRDNESRLYLYALAFFSFFIKFRYFLFLAGRLREVHIEVSTDGQTYDEIVDHPAAIGASKAFDFTPPLPSGRYLKIRLDANEYLTLCEVEVFGDGGKLS